MGDCFMYGLLKDNKVFRILLVYQVFSGLGSGVFSFFMLLAVHLMYQNAMYTGIAGFLMVAPAIFSFAVGPVVDRRDKVKIMRLATLLEFVVLAVLTVLSVLGNVSVVVMFCVLFIYSVANLFESPASSALLPQIMEKEKIMQANSLLQIVALVGAIIVAVFLFSTVTGYVNFSMIYGVSAAFLVVAFVASLFLKDPATKEAESANYMQDLKDGAKFLRNSVLLFLATATLATAFFTQIMAVSRPAFFEYHAGAQGYIVLAVTSLAGGILASVFMGAVGNKLRAGRLISAILLLAGVLRIVFTFVLPFSFGGAVAFIIFYAVAATSYNIVVETLYQKIPPKDMVGRVGTITGTITAAAVATGALTGGFIGSVVPDVQYIFYFHGVMYILIGAIIAFVPSIRTLA
jgi:MFS family permease